MTDFTGAPITDATVTAFREQLTARGVPADQIEATLAKHGHGQQQQQGSPAPERTPRELDINPHTGHPRLNSAELETAAANLRKHWTGDLQVLEAALAKAGASPAVDAADERTQTEREFDGVFGGSDPAGYELRGAYHNAGIPVAELAEVDQDMRAVLSAMDYPKVMAQSLVIDILAANKNGWASLPEGPARTMYGNAETAAAIKATGATSREDFFKTARVATDLMPEDIAHELAEAGVFEDRRVLAAMFRQGERLLLRRGLKANR
jgi:hypothetical protein